MSAVGETAELLCVLRVCGQNRPSRRMGVEGGLLDKGRADGLSTFGPAFAKLAWSQPRTRRAKKRNREGGYAG